MLSVLCRVAAVQAYYGAVMCTDACMPALQLVLCIVSTHLVTSEGPSTTVGISTSLAAGGAGLACEAVRPA